MIDPAKLSACDMSLTLDMLKRAQQEAEAGLNKEITVVEDENKPTSEHRAGYDDNDSKGTGNGQTYYSKTVEKQDSGTKPPTAEDD
jgi:Tfp pilus assembly protein PilX